MFDTFFYNPIYNLVILLSDYIVDAGIVIILATIIIKLILFPLSKSQIKTAIAQKKAKPELEKFQKKYKGKKLTPEEQRNKSLELLAIYKKYNIRPFSAVFLLILQIPILFALYWIFYKGGLPEVNKDILYSFVEVPKEISMNFLGLFPLAEKSVFLALLAGLTQYLHLNISMPEVKLANLKNKSKNMKEDMVNSLQVNLKFGLPILIFFGALVLNSAVAIYFITSNIFLACQEMILRKDKRALKDK